MNITKFVEYSFDIGSAPGLAKYRGLMIPNAYSFDPLIEDHKLRFKIDEWRLINQRVEEMIKEASQ